PSRRAAHISAGACGVGRGARHRTGPELQALERQVLEQSSALDVVAPARPAPPVGALVEPPPARASAEPAAIFGREQEVRTLCDAVAGLERGVGAAIAVTGAAGVGKTRLSEAALAPIASSTRVIWARCVQGDIAPPLWPWLQLAAALGTDGHELADAVRSR